MHRLLSGGLLLAAGLSPVASAGDACMPLFKQLNQAHGHATELAAGAADDRRARFVALETQLFEALKRCPEEADLYALMGEVQLSLGQLPLAAVYGDKAVKLDSRSWRAHQLLGSALAMLGETGRGLAHLETAVSLAPDQPRLQLNYASALLAAKQYDRVLEICDALVETSDRRLAGAAHNLRGQAYLRRGELRQAGHDFDAALKLGFDPQRELHNTDALRPQREPGTAAPSP